VAYLGNDLQVAYPTYKNIDDISGSFNSSATSFSLLVNGVAPVPLPLNSQQCLISVGGVVQRPDDSGTEGFRLSGGNIIFASAPSTGADFFGVILAGADYVNVGANFPSGSAAVPSITFDSDLDTGIYNSAANEISFSTAGTQRLSISSAGQLSNNLGSAAAPSYTFSSDVNTGIYSPGADQIAVATGGTGRLFIDSSGRVGVGTASPQYLFHLQNSSGDTNAFVGQSSTVGLFNQWRYNATTASAYGEISTFGGNNDLRLQSQGGAGNTILNPFSGRVGIGVTSVSDTLHVKGTGVRVEDSGSGTNTRIFYNSVRASDNLDLDAQGASGYITFRTGSSLLERGRFDASGRFLVGTSSSSASARAVFQGNSFAASQPGIIFLQRDTSSTGLTAGNAMGYIIFGDNVGSNYAVIGCEADGSTGSGDYPSRLTFSTTADSASSPTERMRIGNDGATYFGVTTAPSGSVGGSAFLAESDSRRTLYMASTTTGGTTLVVIRNPNGQVGSITTSGSATAFNTSSDYRLKENVAPVNDGITRLQQLKPSRFNFIVEPGKTVDGFIAHEVQAVVPEAIHGTKDAVDDDGNPIYQGIDQSKLVPLLTAALQEAVAKIESLEARLTAAGI